MAYRVCVVKYGYATIDKDSPDEAISAAENEMRDGDFDWSDFCEAQIVEEIKDN